MQVTSVEWQAAAGCSLTGDMYFLDTNTKARLSETYKMDLQKQQAKPCTFRLSNPSSEAVLIVRLDKPYEGELSTWIDLYAKNKQSSVTPIGQYKQAFGWGALHLFEDEPYKDLIIGKAKEISTDFLMRAEDKISDEELAVAILASRAKAGAKKGKLAPVKLKLSITELDFDTQKD